MVRQLLDRVESESGRIVLEDGFGQALTGKQLGQNIRKSAFFWENLCGSGGHHIGMLADGGVLWFTAFLGVIASGNVAAICNPNMSDEDIRAFLRRSDAEFVLCDGAAEDFKQLAGGVPPLSLSFAIGEREGTVAARDPEETIMLLSSSGTSGTRKIVELSDQNMRVYGETIRGDLDFSKGLLIPLPMYHIGGVAAVLQRLLDGYRVVMSLPRTMGRDIRQKNVAKAIMTPSMVQYLLRSPKLLGGVEGKQAMEEICCTGAMIPPKVGEGLNRYGIALSAIYGMTETAGAVSRMESSYREGASGQVCPYNEVKIEQGEILIRGGNVMKGYYKDPAETAKTIKDGWICTGDLGRLDEDGYLYVTGRKKNIIILSNGENVNPEELEGKLGRCPRITECRVYGENDALCAEIYTEEDGTPFAEREKMIRAWMKELNKTLPSTHRLIKLDIKDTELEKTDTGKIRRTQAEVCEEKI